MADIAAPRLYSLTEITGQRSAMDRQVTITQRWSMSRNMLYRVLGSMGLSLPLIPLLLPLGGPTVAIVGYALATAAGTWALSWRSKDGLDEALYRRVAARLRDNPGTIYLAGQEVDPLESRVGCLVQGAAMMPVTSLAGTRFVMVDRSRRLSGVPSGGIPGSH